ncbi:maleylpyruvate isomerase family mycothiol-dependent enzyme [Ornithinimicrobium sp. Arc0846-15]|nr:maleylpyruvate isomerase family mycothiol-dependent enzyme [Ornithinimicrobium laminariae]
MNKAQKAAIWDAVHRERLALAGDLRGLEQVHWDTASLCDGWSVHDLLAHLIDAAKTTRLGFAWRLAQARFDFDADNEVGVRRERRDAPQDSLAEWRRVAYFTATPPAPLSSRLVEAFVHGEDIRRPLGFEGDYPIEYVVTALKLQLATSVKMGGGKEIARGRRLVATDADLDVGEGPRVRGRSIDLLMLVSGRS